ncbi:Phytochrome [Psidium guajava]|nr:Phytochrome [Psidium guajava]
MSVSNAGTCDRKRSDGNGCKFPPLGKVPPFFNLFCARERQSPAKNSDGLSDSGGGCVARINSRFSRKKGIGHGGSLGDKGRAFCFGRPRALESTAASRSSDANDPTFTHEMMRNSLEKNDFYSKECNPHLRR